MTLENLDSVEPIDEPEDMWFPLERILTNWIYMFRIGKITADSPEGESARRAVIANRALVLASIFS
jgi:hypothetical protein